LIFNLNQSSGPGTAVSKTERNRRPLDLTKPEHRGDASEGRRRTAGRCPSCARRSGSV
jgi:hypothetical protein